MRQSEINVFYGHELYAHLLGKEFCDCDECADIRPKIYAMLWREVKKKKKEKEPEEDKVCKHYFEIGHEGNPTPCCRKKGVINCNCITCKEEEF